MLCSENYTTLGGRPICLAHINRPVESFSHLHSSVPRGPFSLADLHPLRRLIYTAFSVLMRRGDITDYNINTVLPAQRNAQL